MTKVHPQLGNTATSDRSPRHKSIKVTRRLRTLPRDVLVHLRTDAGMFEHAEQDLRAIRGESWAIGIGRYPTRAERCRELATWVEDEYRALMGGHQRNVPLDDRGMFPGTLAP